jgi:hypothetical protein
MSALDVRDRTQPIGVSTEEPADATTRPPAPSTRGPFGPRVLEWLQARFSDPQALVTFAVVVVACGFVFFQMQPSRLFANTTPSGGDMGAHVWQPAYLRHHLFHHFRITGWAPDWYAGFPSLVFYFPLPSFVIAVLSFILPYNVAFKLVSVSGLIALPAAAWAFGRLARLRFPGPACLAAATLPFLFTRGFSIYGGNIASTLAGEFSFSIGLALALVFLGLVARGLETGRYRGWAAVLLALTGLCHLLPTIFAVLGAIVLTALRWEWHRVKWTAPVLGVSALLAAFWSVPFILRLPYATDMGYEKVTQYSKELLTKPPAWVLVMAGVGLILSLVRGQKIGVFLACMAGISALIFGFAPQARLWNARALPFWYFSLYLLAGLALAECGILIVKVFDRSAAGTTDTAAGSEHWSLIIVPVLTAIGALVIVGYPLRILPFGSVNHQNDRYSWLGISTASKSFIPDWVKWNYSGYQSNTKSRRAEYFALVDTMRRLGKTDGCGRAMWEYESEEDQMGTPMALMLLPYWTNGCVGSMEGLYFESSATTPYHFLNAAELSLHPSNPVRGLNYAASPNIAEGVAHLQLLGVKYYMALTPETQSQADTNSMLRLVATSGPWPVTYYTGNTGQTKQRTWKIYEIEDSDVVSPLLNQPVVMKGLGAGGKVWLEPSEAWYLDAGRRDVLYAASGPRSWTRVSPNDTQPPRTALAPVQVANIKTGDNSVSFDVDTTGVPVLVKASYFPNWKASGAHGPWRVTPNLMVVVPTSHHVRLHYGYTPVDVLGILLSLLGVAGVVWMARRKPVQYPATGARPITSAPPPADVIVDEAPRTPVDGPDPYVRLKDELAGAFPTLHTAEGQAGRVDDNLDVWLGFPAGLDLARYHTSDYGLGSMARPAEAAGESEAASGAEEARGAEEVRAGEAEDDESGEEPAGGPADPDRTT